MVKEIDAIHHPKPMMLELPSIPVFQYESSATEEADAGRLDRVGTTRHRATIGSCAGVPEAVSRSGRARRR